LHRDRNIFGVVMILSVLLLLVAAGRVAQGEEVDEPVECTVKIEYEEQLGEQFATAPTVGEASDRAIENACALVCVETKGGDAGVGDGGKEVDKNAEIDGKAVASEDPLGIEPCIEACLEDAIVMGTMCIDRSSQTTLYVDGIYDSESDSGDESP